MCVIKFVWQESGAVDVTAAAAAGVRASFCLAWMNVLQPPDCSTQQTSRALLNKVNENIN